MDKIRTILRYEYKMQLTRSATWGVFFMAAFMSLLDNFPSPENLKRLEFLSQPSYFLCRTMSLDGLIMVFGLVILLAGSFPGDDKTGVKPLFLSAPVSRGQYISGKLAAGFLFSFTMLTLFLTANTLIYFAAVPVRVSAADCLDPLLKTLLISVLPVSLFTGFTAAALPALMDIRLFYLSAAVFFLMNASYVGSAEAMPFYLVTSGDLMKLIWQHPRWSFANSGSIQANLLFLTGCGLLSGSLLFLRRSFWRAGS